MIITIHQPEHLPWLGLLNKVAKAEKFVVLDGVQFEKNYFQNRNRILGTNGPQWINVPVTNKGHMNSTIATIAISKDPKNVKWRVKYLQTIKQSYGKYPYFAEVFPIVENAITLDTEYLYDVNFAIIKGFLDSIDVYPEYIRSSELKANGLKSNLILDICKEVNASTYIAGPSGRDYLDMDSFKRANIEVKFNDYHHPVYPQKRTIEFVSHLSALDLFMNVGFKEGKRIIMNGNEGLSDF